MFSFDDKKLTIPESFSGKSIFITGGTGYIGEVLIEKLLRSCPGIKNIYVLVRPKRNKNAEDRIKALLDVPLFDKLKKENKSAIDKIVPIIGYVDRLNLGLSEEDTTTLINNVSIVYHVAASVRFDDFLKSAILTNTRSTREVIFLCKRLKSIDAFVHVSTAYCHADHAYIEEKAYAPVQDWREAIEIAEKYDEETLQVLSQKYIHPMPNTYTFTKALAERVVIDLCENQLPAVIVRPTIVIPTFSEPVCGWLDNFNGPSGLSIIGGKGLLKVFLGRPDCMQSYTFVDNVAKAMAISAWSKIIEPNPCRTEIHNVDDLDMRLGEYVKLMRSVSEFNPMESYFTTARDNIFCQHVSSFYFLTLFFHVLSGILLDGAFFVSGRKPMVLKIYRKTFIANMAVRKFVTFSFSFESANYQRMKDSVMESDRTAFSFNEPLNTPEKQFRTAESMWIGIKKYLLCDYSVPTDAVIKNYRRREMAHNIVAYSMVAFIYYWILTKVLLPGITSFIEVEGVET